MTDNVTQNEPVINFFCVTWTDSGAHLLRPPEPTAAALTCAPMSPKSNSAFVARTNALVARFRRQRPMRGGSLLVTILGDAIAPRGGTIALASLIRLAVPFGLTERLVRTSIGRLANEEWVSFERSGRASFYSLTTNGRARFAEATQRIYGAPPQDWDGLWTMVIAPPSLKS